MKVYRIFFYTFSIILISGTVFPQSGWFWLNPKPQGNSLNSVKFVNSQTGFAAGNFGTIMRTNNAGENWSVYNSNFTNDLYSLAFTDENTVYACGSGGIILKTTNSGNSWNSINSGTNDTLYSVYFNDANTGYSCGRNGRIIKTTDAGSSWIKLNSGTANTLKSIFFTTGEKGYICGEEIVLRTTNGGNSWSSNNYSSFTYNAIFFINETTGFMGGGIYSGFSRDFRKTTNGGNTWVNVFLAPSEAITSIQFISTTTGFVSGRSNNFFKTTNGGLNWSYDNTISGEGYSLASVYFPNSGEGYIAGSYGTIFKSVNSGNNWTVKAPQGIMEDFREISFPSQNTGYVNTGGAIYKTSDGGSNWVFQTSMYYTYDLNFLNNNTGYAVYHEFSTSNYSLVKSVNGGASWDYSFTSSPNYYIYYQFINEGTGFLCPDNDVLYKTTNSGANWIPRSFNSEYIMKFDFPSVDAGYMIRESTGYKLYKTTDLGVNWNFVTNMDSINFNYRTLNFINENTGFIFIMYSSTENFCELNRTTNGGIDWHPVYSIDSTIYYHTFGSLEVKFINSNTGFITKVGDELIKTTDSGENWFNVKVADRQVSDIAFADDNIGYFIGSAGMIKKTTNGGVIAVENISSFVPEKFTLKQNYPNPFNPVTNLEFGISNLGFVTLKIYDILGKEVETLINENKSAGTYSVEWNAADFPSGIYFYELKVNDFSETRKMILLK